MSPEVPLYKSIEAGRSLTHLQKRKKALKTGIGVRLKPSGELRRGLKQVMQGLISPGEEFNEQADSRGMADSVPDHCHKGTMAIKTVVIFLLVEDFAFDL